ncbi:WD40-repeat-containing domain protein [Mycotypha africana]|uniref:WD40-repeat-containing domain protein n=1 Tax=Mycotypha africana TaxID=64632 RepID=UPI002301FB24|nr:WD40-repeat-containing domain protein [Mycotypha africana]KAI8979483.1 WD40-repeat-containing domain protein [Mycotypha africana]
MTNRLPFTKLVHSPSKSELAIANGHHFLVVNSVTGDILKSYPKEAIQIDNVSDYYRSMVFNNNGSMLATSGENKEICVWDTTDWSLKLKRPAYKRINALDFDKNSTKIMAADKFGDVYCHPMKDHVDGEEKLNPIVGHVSMVTDMLLTPDEKYVITSDRDEHIRVSRYPNGYNIESFCLGHTDVVTRIEILPWNENILVSSGGDCTVRIWDYLKGTEISSIDLKQHILAYKPPTTDANSEDAIVNNIVFDSKSKMCAVVFAKSPAVIILQWNDHNQQFLFKQTVVLSSPILDIAFDLEGKLWAALDGDLLMTVIISEDGKFVEKNDAEVLKQINETETCKTDKLPDLYTIFGLRKFLDLPENIAEEHKSKKKRTE